MGPQEGVRLMGAGTLTRRRRLAAYIASTIAVTFIAISQTSTLPCPEAPSADMAHWWEAWDDTALITSDGSGVTDIADCGSAVRDNLSRFDAYPDQRLQYEATGGPNSKPSVSGGGGFNSFVADFGEIPTGTEAAVFVVYKMPSGSYPFSVGAIWPDPITIDAYEYTGSQALDVKTGGGTLTSLTHAVDSSWHLIEVDFRTGGVTARRDGVLQAVGGSGGVAAITRAGWSGDSGGELAHMSIVTSPTTEKIAAMRAYLADRYALATEVAAAANAGSDVSATIPAGATIDASASVGATSFATTILSGPTTSSTCSVTSKTGYNGGTVWECTDGTACEIVDGTTSTPDVYCYSGDDDGAGAGAYVAQVCINGETSGAGCDTVTLNITCTTPNPLYPVLCYEDPRITDAVTPVAVAVPSLDAGYDLVVNTNGNGDAWGPGCTACGKTALNAVCAADNARIRVDVDLTAGGPTLNLVGCTDVEIALSDTVNIHGLIFINGVDNLRIYGLGPTASIDSLYYTGAASTDVSVDSLLWYDSDGSRDTGRVLDTIGGNSRLSIAHVIMRGNNPTGGSYGMLFDRVDHFTFLNSAIYTDPKESINSWGFRVSGAGAVSEGTIFYDSWVECGDGTGASQPAIRGANGLAFIGSTLLQMNSPNCRGLQDLDNAATNWWQWDSDIYSSINAGTNALALTGNNHLSGVRWHSDASGTCSISEATLLALETTAGVPAGRYTSGSDTYDTSNTRPTPPQIVSPRGFTLDAARDGTYSGDPQDLPIP
jgi:hypothetical protein